MTDRIQVDESPTSGKITLGLSIIVRVTLKDGTFHEVGTQRCAKAGRWLTVSRILATAT